MNLGHELAEILPELQEAAESRMTSTCTITGPGGEPVWDDETGTYITVPGEAIYEGKCRLRWGNPAPQNASAGEAAWAVDRTGTLSLPLAGTAHVGDGAVVTITANPNDPGMVGLVLHVLTGHHQTDSTARRLPVEVVTRDV